MAPILVYFSDVEEVHDFLQRFFSLFLARHIGEGFACLGLNIDPGIALAKGHHIAHSGLQLPGEQSPKPIISRAGTIRLKR